MKWWYLPLGVVAAAGFTVVAIKVGGKKADAKPSADTQTPRDVGFEKILKVTRVGDSGCRLDIVDPATLFDMMSASAQSLGLMGDQAKAGDFIMTMIGAYAPVCHGRPAAQIKVTLPDSREETLDELVAHANAHTFNAARELVYAWLVDHGYKSKLPSVTDPV